MRLSIMNSSNTTSCDRKNADIMRQHTIQLIPLTVAGIEAVNANSDISFGRNNHDPFGIGLMDSGGQKSLYTGVAYLLFMAWQTLRDKTLLSADRPGLALSHRALIQQAVVANLLNPKLSLFFLAFLPQFIATRDVHPTQSMLLLSAIFAAMTFAVFSLYGIFASAVSHSVLGNHRVMTGIRWGVALAFTAVGIRLAMAVQ